MRCIDGSHAGMSRVPGRARFNMRGVWSYAGADQSPTGTLEGDGIRYMRFAPSAVSTGSVSGDESPYLHCDEQTLEEYCFGILSEKRTSAVEEHLLVCEDCTEALAVQSEFIHCLKAALRVQRGPEQLAYFQKSA